MESLLHPSHLLTLTEPAREVSSASWPALVMPPDPATRFKGPLHVPKHVRGPSRWIWPRSQPPVAADAKVNDVLLSAVAGALRHYLLDHDDLVDGMEVRRGARQLSR
ncbi:MAG: hypothetical protein R2851_05790 [Caldilineaceae bacterium]